MGGRRRRGFDARRGRFDRVHRSPNLRPLRRIHVVLTEGKTEARFIEGLRQRHRLSNVQVRVVGQIGDPGRIVQEAKARRDELSGEGRHGDDWLVHVVFDRDEHPRFAAACEEARRCSFVLGVSVPCFELWLILLRADQTAHIDRATAQRRCRQLHPGYCHNSNPVVEVASVTEEELRAAADRCQRLRDRADGEHFRNPSSTFSLVIAEILDDLDQG